MSGRVLPTPPPGTSGLPETGLPVLITRGFADYGLLDSGNGRKLERFGRICVDRPEPQAMWQPRLNTSAWQRADAQFSPSGDKEEGVSGRWRTNTPVPKSWPLKVEGISVLCRLTGFRHLGLFPEQLPHWQWMRARLGSVTGEAPRVLNLFAYTGAATLIAAAAGAAVTHLDASKTAIAWAKENQALSDLSAAPIRYILEDARKFVAREVRRGRTYHVILVDPPKFGRGPGGEVFEVFAHLPELLRGCAGLLARGPAAMVLTTYAIRASSLAMGALVSECLGERSGRCDCGELAVREASGGRLLSTSLYARWISDDAVP